MVELCSHCAYGLIVKDERKAARQRQCVDRHLAKIWPPDLVACGNVNEHCYGVPLALPALVRGVLGPDAWVTPTTLQRPNPG